MNNKVDDSKDSKLEDTSVKEKGTSTKEKSESFKDKKLNHLMVLKCQFLPNNIRIDIMDVSGRLFISKTAGTEGISNSRKKTPHTACTIMAAACRALYRGGCKEVQLFISGFTMGRDTALRYIKDFRHITVLFVQDVTPIPHNGCRPKKLKRI